MSDDWLATSLDRLVDRIVNSLDRIGDELKLIREQHAPPPKAELSLPPRCQQVRPALCGLQDEDGRSPRGNFEHPHAWICRGCHERFEE